MRIVSLSWTIALFFWLISPAAAQSVEAWSRAAEERASELGRLPEDQNGFVLLQPYMQAPTADGSFAALEPYFHLWPGRIETTGTAWEKDREHFREIWPLLEEALKRPHFHYTVDWQLGVEGTMPSLINLLTLLKSAHVDSYAREDTTSGVLGLELADKMSGNGSLLHQMIVIAIHRDSSEMLFQLLAARNLSGAQLIELANRLESVGLRPEALTLAWDEEIARMLITVDRMAEGKHTDPNIVAEFENNPGLANALKSTYKKYYEKYRPRLLENIPTANWSDEFRKDEEVETAQSAAGYMVFQALAGLPGSDLTWRKALLRDQALRLVVALEVSSANGQGFPESIEALSGFEPAWHELGYKKTESGYSLDADIWFGDETLREF